jgi:glycosyltransferase involved in cell wall biosynthesis
MQTLFFVLLFLTFFPYVIFPLLMFLVCRLKPLGWRRQEVFPSVTLIISIYDEEEVIGAKVENSLQLDYPRELLEILVVSDGSTDKSHEIVEGFSDPRVKLRIFTDRAGKTECLNRVVPEARGCIIVFTDANSMFPTETLKNISRNFADESIGSVTGWTKYRAAVGGQESTGLYARLEKVTKHGESLLSSCVGADGAIFAIRKALYLPLENYDINDFVIPLNVVAQHKRVVLDPDVFCYEAPSEGEMKEYRRQARITNRTLGAIWRGRQFLNPQTYGSFSLLLLSHKVLRFLVPFFFVATLLLSLYLSETSGFYALFFLAQLAFILLGSAGLLRRLDGRLINLCAFILLTIAAQFVGWYRFAIGKRDTLWTPQR